MKLEIRRAQAEDREAVLAFCAHTWEDGDYIDQVWEDWLSDEADPLLVGLLAGRPVALEKIRLTSPDQVWLEGMRVDPDHRGRGIATSLFHHALDWARSHGARVARLATGSDNEAVHRMVAEVGLRRVYSSPYYVAEEPSEGPVPERLGLLAEEETWSSLQRWGGLARSHGLYMDEWAWLPLTPERLQGHLSAGQVWGVRRGVELAALAVARVVSDGDEGVVVGLLDGDLAGLRQMALSLRALAGGCTPAKAEVTPREEPALLELLEEAGYRRGWEGTFWVFEGSL